MHWNTHSRSPRLAEVRCGVFSIVLMGNQIAEYFAGLLLNGSSSEGKQIICSVLA
jgi:hypothetical protein